MIEQITMQQVYQNCYDDWSHFKVAISGMCHSYQSKQRLARVWFNARGTFGIIMMGARNHFYTVGGKKISPLQKFV